MHEGGLTIALDGERVIVRRADGRVIEHVPQAPQVRDSAEALARASAEQGIVIDARTSTPGWGGERADYAYIVAMIGDRDRAA